MDGSLDDIGAISGVLELLAAGNARSIRESVGVSQQDLASVIGCSRAAISRYESGSRRPTGRRAARYAEALAECIHVAEQLTQ